MTKGNTKAKPQKTDFIRARVDPKLKAEAEAILDQIGLNASDVIRTLYRQIVLRKGLPYELKIPNAESRRALAEVERGEVKGYDDLAELDRTLRGEDNP